MALGTLHAGLAGVGLALTLMGACSREDHPPPLPLAPPGPTSTIPDGGLALDGAPGDGGCGTQVLPAVVDAPVLEFVFDRSGSMSEPIDDSGTSKYEAARAAVGSVLASIGNRFAYGAAVFPSSGEAGSCDPGFAVFPPTLGDAPSTVPANGRGRILSGFLARLALYTPGGATPTASSLRSLLGTFKRFKARTHVVLLTDGAPNCDFSVACDSDACIPDIEGATFGDQRCGVTVSCCDPKFFGAGASANCVDADGTEVAVKALADAGFETYVVGMPGTELYASVLDRLAVAGNTPRAGSPRYYAVSDTKALGEALFEIGTGLSIGCDITLDTPPPNRELVNVYFDGAVLPKDAENGWDYGGETVVTVFGEACANLKAAEVREVKITYGCQTIVR
jgi:hypothetical protein